MSYTDPAASRGAAAEEIGWLVSWCARVVLLAEQADQLAETELRRQLARHAERARRRSYVAAEIERKRAAGFREPSQ